MHDDALPDVSPPGKERKQIHEQPLPAVVVAPADADAISSFRTAVSPPRSAVPHRKVGLAEAPSNSFTHDPISHSDILRDRMVSTETRHPVAIELCCGSAGLSAALAARGFKCVAVDCARNRFRAKHAITMLDLETPEAVEIICDAISQGQTRFVFAAPPCGTASRSREIPISAGMLKHFKGNPPKQLRSEQFPLGLPNLSGLDAVKVAAANRVYNNIGLILLFALQLGIGIGVESPFSSYLWFIWPFCTFLARGCFDSVFQHCCHGGRRPKWARVRTNIASFRTLDRTCPGESADHVHLPWGVSLQNGSVAFATAEETEYPTPLCVAIADAAVDDAVQAGCSNVGRQFNPSILDATEKQLQKMAGFADRSSTGKRPAPLVSEFHEVCTIDQSLVDPIIHRVLRTISQRGDGGCATKVVVGVIREPDDFLVQALKAKHPVDLDSAIPKQLIANIDWLLNVGPVECAAVRVRAIRMVAKLVSDNALEDASMLKDRTPYQKHILKGKKMFSLKCLARMIHHKDLSVVDEACEGFRLTGLQKFTGYFEEQLLLPIITTQQLLDAAEINNKTILAKVRSSGNDALDSEVWDQAKQELKAGWLLGPCYSFEELSKIVGPKVVVSRRFGLQQGAKVRSIDDLNESNVNLAFGYCDKLRFHDVDTIAAVANHIRVKVSHPDSPKVHKDWSDPLLQFLGRTLDLKSAYKQWALHDSEIACAVTAIWNPVVNKVAMCPQGTLPFGACSSVLNFNRLSRLGWELLVQILRLIVTNFYDDYPCFEPAGTARMAKLASETLFALLGWQCATEGSKALDFAASFAALGVAFYLERLNQGEALVGNKLSRIDDVCDDLAKVIKDKVMTGSMCASLQGKLQYMERHVFGRTGKFVTRALRVGGQLSSSTVKLGAEDVAAFSAIIGWLRESAPRALAPADFLPPLLLFTDGAEEGPIDNSVASCGAFLVDPVDSLRECFGAVIDNALVAEWKSDGATKIIAQAELLPIVVSKRLWSKRLYRRRVLCFVDNESAKFACINMDSPSIHNRNILMALACEETRVQTWTWYSRVPSHSNPSDAASRMDLKTMVDNFRAKVVSAVLPKSLVGGQWH